MSGSVLGEVTTCTEYFTGRTDNKAYALGNQIMSIRDLKKILDSQVRYVCIFRLVWSGKVSLTKQWRIFKFKVL